MINPAFDLDGTLVDTEKLIIKALKEMGYKPDVQNEYNYKFIDGYEPPPDFLWDVFFYRLLIERYREIEAIDEYAGRFLKKLQDKAESPIKIITARTEGVHMHSACKKLLERVYPDIYFSIDVVSGGSEKYKYMDGHSIFFDDRRQTAIDLANRNFIVFMRNAEYNKLPEDKTISVKDYPAPYSGGDIVVFDSFSELMRGDLMDLFLGW